MTGPMLLSNLAALAVQMTVLVAAAALLARAFCIESPKALLGYWRTLLLACLLLPLAQPWNVVPTSTLSAAAVLTPVAGVATHDSAELVARPARRRGPSASSCLPHLPPASSGGPCGWRLALSASGGCDGTRDRSIHCPRACAARRSRPEHTPSCTSRSACPDRSPTGIFVR